MEDLKTTDDEVHVWRGEYLFEVARGLNKIEDAVPLYTLALEDYTQAIKLAPANINALNEYAYAFWDWRSSAGGRLEVAPDASVAGPAREYASEATRLTRDSGSQALHVQVKSTLGEVLLGEGRPDEAIKVLEELVLPQARRGSTQMALEPPKIGTHPFFNEVRWDLAKAYRCENFNGVHTHAPGGRRHDLKTKADQLFKKIRETEENREDKPYTPFLDILDTPAGAAVLKGICQGLAKYYSE